MPRTATQPAPRSVATLCAALLLFAACSAPAEDTPQADTSTEGTDSAPDTGADTDANDTQPPDDDDGDATTAPQGVWPLMAFGSAREGFWAAPFPDGARLRADGRPDMAGYPNPTANPMVGALVEILSQDVDGFGTTSAVYLPLSGPIDPSSLPPTIAETTWEQDRGAALFDMDATNRIDSLARHPVSVTYEADGGPYGGSHMLSLLPAQGFPLREGGLYAAVITDAVRDADGQPLRPSPQMEALRRGERPDEISDAAWADYQRVLASLPRGQGALPLEDIVGLTVFRAGHPTEGLRRAWAQVKAAAPPVMPAPSEWRAQEVFDRFCVYEGAVEVPVFQEGEPPFMSEGGAWRWSAEGALIQQGTERARLIVTLPRAPMPAAGFPLVVMVRTGGGGDRPLVDRGVRATAGGESTPGTGPAMNLAAASLAGLSIDGPHGGWRNVTGGDEQFLIFNIQNPVAMRDNIRQSALELALLAELLGAVQLDASACPGLTTPAGDGLARLDVRRVGLMGHSMGATIAPLVLALQPKYRAAVLSGAGGSWIENILHKKLPLEVAPLAKLILGYRSRALHAHDPALNLLQWAGEAADPPVYAGHVIRAPWEGDPRQVLMFQGIADTYILPPIANPLTFALGLDVGAPVLDAADSVTGAYPSVEGLLGLAGGRVVALPVSGNLRGEAVWDVYVTGVLSQHRQDPIEDGHEVMFQTPGPKHQYRCFFQSALRDQPARVPAPGGEWDDCPAQ